MKDTFKEGMIRKETILVDKDRTIGFLGEGLRVYATPDLIRDIEHTCLDFIKEYADDNEHSVGTYVEVIHGAGSPLGMSVDIAIKSPYFRHWAATIAAPHIDPTETSPLRRDCLLDSPDERAR
jgi:predicted thioesterase